MSQDDDGWSNEVFAQIREAGISLITTVPDAGLTRLLRICGSDPAIRVMTLSTEEEGVGVGYGAWLGGTRSLLCLQSSGTGNIINGLALPAFAESPCLMLVTMRGQEGEGNPAQFPMGRAVRPVFEAMGVTCLEAMTAEEVVSHFRKACEMAFAEGKMVAVLIAQKVVGAKTFGK
ncbi:MAG: phosphonopyruvate decarboxylase [Hyphomicrobiaceae bacterium]|nr:phosphonopyruvate decarboxylase [Hyphomicrobiaceae bacterium]